MKKDRMRVVMQKVVRGLMNPYPVLSFMRNLRLRCRVPGCGKFSYKRALCVRHQGSTKWQHLAQRRAR